MNESGVLLKTRFFAALTTAVLIWAMFAGLAANVSANRGGGDAYGYSWTDSNAPPPSVSFDWIDITGVGVDSMVAGDDQVSTGIDIGFSFRFYGVDYTTAYFSTNGLITLGSGSSDWSNDPIPNSNAPNLYIAPFWDDLCANYSYYNAGTIYYQTLGSTPNQQLIVEWWQVSRLGSTTELTFEAILNETGEVWFQYLDLNGETGAWATVGIENAAGTIGSQYSYDQPALSDSLAVMFTPSPIGVTPSSQTSGAHPGDSAFYAITITNNRPLTDSFDVTNVSDAGWDVSLFDSVFNPLTDSNSNGIPDTGDVLSGASVDILVRVDVPVDPVVRYDKTTVIVTSYLNSDESTAVQVTTKVLAARFVAPHSDFGNDTDMDGQYNYLEVNVSLNVTFYGSYYLYADLYDTMWADVGPASYSGYLSPGETTLRLTFTGWYLNLGGHDGPYNVELYLYDSEMWSLDYNLHVTGAYTSDEFEDPPASLEPPYSDHAEDYDSNGYYDALVVTVPVNVTEAGTFDVHVTLWDEWVFMMFGDAHREVYLETGIHDVEIVFDGRDLWDFGYFGRYGAEILLETDIGEYLGNDVYITDLYWAMEFEPPGARLSPSHSEYGLDTNGNGYYDLLVIEVPVHVSKEGEYTISGTLYDPWPSSVDDDSNTTHLDVGIQTVELRFFGKSIYYFGYDGAYFVDVTLYEEDMDWIDQMMYNTDSYDHDEFEPPGARLEPPHSDSVLDTNGNSYYDYLIINISVNVSTPGFYRVDVALYDSLWGYIDSLSNYTYLGEGVQDVQLLYGGTNLHLGPFDGPYIADMTLWDEDGYWLSMDTYWTAAHLGDEFEPLGATFSPPHEDSGMDTDDDGLYDYLAVNISVDVFTTGDYIVEASLSPIFIFESVEVYLDAGLQVVQVNFYGRQINMSGYDGAFSVNLAIFDSDWNPLDYSTHVTGVYSWNQFESLPVEFSSPHEDYGQNTSGGSDFEYLVVNGTVDVAEAGIYTIDATAWGAVTVYSHAEAYLDVGLQVMTVMFPAWPLHASGYTGTYSVNMDVYDEEGTWWSFDNYVTDSYDFNDFNGTPPMISSSWTDSAPMIDGVVDPGEWDSTGAVDLVEEDPSNNLGSMMIVMNNATHLFVYYDVVGDMTEDEGDASSFSFDTGNDGETTTGGEDQFAMYCTPDATTHYKYDAGWWAVDCSPFDPELSDHEGMVGAYGFGPSEFESGDHRIFEYAIPLALIDASPGDVLGFFAASQSVPGVLNVLPVWEYSLWPNYYGSPPAPDLYGDIALAPDRPLTTATLEGTMGDDGWYVSDVTVMLDSSGGDGGVDHSMYCVGGGSWATYAGAFDVAAQGSVLVEFYSVDMMGNEEAVRSVSFMADSVAPVTSHAVTEGYDVDLTAADTASGVRSTYYRIDDDPWMDYAGNFSVDDSESHTVEFYSVDNAGNEEPVNSVMLNETLSPNTIMTIIGGKGLGDVYITPSVIVVLTASDNAGGSGVATTMYRLDGGTWQVYPLGGVEVEGDGEHSVEIYSIDNVGNEETVESAVFEIDSTTPVTIAEVDGSNVTLSASDAGSGVAATMYRIDGGDWIEYGEKLSITTPGNHTVDFYSVDVAGNVEMADSVVVQNAPAEEEGDDEGGGISAFVSGVLGLVIGAIVVAAIMMLLMRKKQSVTAAPEEPAPEDDIAPPPT